MREYKLLGHSVESEAERIEKIVREKLEFDNGLFN